MRRGRESELFCWQPTTSTFLDIFPLKISRQNNTFASNVVLLVGEVAQEFSKMCALSSPVSV